MYICVYAYIDICTHTHTHIYNKTHLKKKGTGFDAQQCSLKETCFYPALNTDLHFSKIELCSYKTDL